MNNLNDSFNISLCRIMANDAKSRDFTKYNTLKNESIEGIDKSIENCKLRKKSVIFNCTTAFALRRIELGNFFFLVKVPRQPNING